MTLLDLGVAEPAAGQGFTLGDLRLWLRHCDAIGVPDAALVRSRLGHKLDMIRLWADVPKVDFTITGVLSFGLDGEAEAAEPSHDEIDGDGNCAACDAQDEPDAARACDEQHAEDLADDGSDIDEPAEPAATFGCKECGSVLLSAQGLAAHRGAKHSGKTFLCECGRVFASASGLGGHRRSCPARPSVPVEKPETVADELAAEMPEPVAVVEEPAAAVASTPAPAVSSAAPHPMVAMCSCGHTQRRHDGFDGYCLVGDCECSAYAAVAA